jgi:hypothetical protein
MILVFKYIKKSRNILKCLWQILQMLKKKHSYIIWTIK